MTGGVTALTSAGPTAVAAARAQLALEEAAPTLVAGFRDNLDRAADVVNRRLVGAAYREGLAGDHRGVLWSGDRTFLPTSDGGYVLTRARRHGFDRIEIREPVAADPARLLRRLAPTMDDAGEHDDGVAAELTDATVNLALAYARREHRSAQVIALALETGAVDSLDLAAGLDADAQSVFFEQFATEGHNLHPCGRTRIGWSVPDLLAHDLESAGTDIGFVGVRRTVHSGDDVGDQLLADLPIDPTRYAVTPVHAWQLDHVVRGRYADLVADGTLVPLAATIPATPTAALRTLLLPADSTGGRRYLKASLDIQVTSTRRTISVASTRNGPVLSALLSTLLAAASEDSLGRVLLMAETAGSATVASGGRERDLAAILRNGLSGRLAPGEVAVSGGALYGISPVTGTTVVAEIVNRFGRTRGLARPDEAALAFIGEYARLVLPPVLTLATRYGIGLEAHLQNCVPTFVDGVPHRLALRDFAGLRVYPARLPAPLALWPGSVVLTHDADIMRAKVAYTVLQAHLGEIVIRLGESHGLDEPAAWSAVRDVIDEVFDGLRADPAVAAAAHDDHAFLTAPTLPHKALLTMRLATGRGRVGDIYVRVENPLR